MRPIPAAEEFENLEDENLQLREELNACKGKVVELKKAAAKRQSDWKKEMLTVSEELAAKESLEEEAAALRTERARLQEDLANAKKHSDKRESAANAEIERLRAEMSRTQ